MTFRCISATKRIQIIRYEAFAGKLSPSAPQRRPSSEHDQVTHFRHVAKPTAGREAVPSHLRPRKQLTQYIRCRVNAHRPTTQAQLSLFRGQDRLSSELNSLHSNHARIIQSSASLCISFCILLQLARPLLSCPSLPT